MTKRDYAKEYREYHSRPEQRKNRSERNKARRLAKKLFGEQAIEGKDIDHIKPMSKGGKTTKSNIRISSVARNRARKGTKGRE